MSRVIYFTSITLIALFPMLASCDAHYDAGSEMRIQSLSAPLNEQSQLRQQKLREEAMWAEVGRMSMEACGITAAPPPRERVVSQSHCVTSLVQKHVLPIAAFPELVMESRARAHVIAGDYAAGRLTPAQYHAMSITRVEDYSNRWLIQAAQKVLEPQTKKVQVTRL